MSVQIWHSHSFNLTRRLVQIWHSHSFNLTHRLVQIWHPEQVLLVAGALGNFIHIIIVLRLV